MRQLTDIGIWNAAIHGIARELTKKVLSCTFNYFLINMNPMFHLRGVDGGFCGLQITNIIDHIVL